MITKLTVEQKADLAVARDEWLRIGLSTERIDRERAKVAVARMYESAGLAPPSTYVFLANPLQGAIGAHLLAQVWAQVGDQVGAQVGAQVWDQVWAQVVAQVVAQVGDQVVAQVRDQVGDQVRDQVGDQVGAQVGRASYGSHDAAWIGFYAYFRKHFGLAERITGMAEVAQSCGWVWPFANAAIITDRPTAIRFDAERRLHCETGPAIEYDGFTVHAWRGTRVPAEWIDDRATLSAADVLAHENTEVRRAGCEILGWDRIIDQLGGTVICADADPQIGTLVEVTLPDNGPARFLRVQCGTGRTFALCVPNHVTTPIEAQAALHGLSVDDFTPPTLRT